MSRDSKDERKIIKDRAKRKINNIKYINISQLIRFARASSNVNDSNNCYKFLTAKLLKQGYLYHKLRNAFSKLYRRNFELIAKYHVSLEKLLQQGISNPEFYEDLIKKLKKKIVGNPNFCDFVTYCKTFQESMVYFRHNATDCMPIL